MGDTVIAEKTDLRSNKIHEIIDSVLSYLHIGGAKIHYIIKQNIYHHKYYHSQND